MIGDLVAIALLVAAALTGIYLALWPYLHHR